MNGDPRTTPARPDLAAASLEGQVEAERFVGGQTVMVRAPKTMLLRRPDPALSPDTELLHGEAFSVLEINDGWAWGQALDDSYVGYLPARNLSSDARKPTHRVATLAAQIYATPTLKVPSVGRLPFGARVEIVQISDGYGAMGPGRWIALPQLRAIDQPVDDWVASAEQFLGVPYIWGGRSSFGLDCSALVQLARQSAGHPCPRDSDMQQDALGEDLPDGASLRRGDLIFWKGHVGIMRDERLLLHANAHHMAVVTEPLAEALARIEKAEFGSIVRRARLDAGGRAP